MTSIPRPLARSAISARAASPSPDKGLTNNTGRRDTSAGSQPPAEGCRMDGLIVRTELRRSSCSSLSPPARARLPNVTTSCGTASARVTHAPPRPVDDLLPRQVGLEDVVAPSIRGEDPTAYRDVTVRMSLLQGTILRNPPAGTSSILSSDWRSGRGALRHPPDRTRGSRVPAGGRPHHVLHLARGHRLGQRHPFVPRGPGAGHPSPDEVIWGTCAEDALNAAAATDMPGPSLRQHAETVLLLAEPGGTGSGIAADAPPARAGTGTTSKDSGLQRH